MIQIGQCTFHHPFLGKCLNSGVRLLLQDDMGRYVQRTLCRAHSDWVKAKPPQQPVSASSAQEE